MAISYSDALAIVEAVALKMHRISSEELPLAQAVGRITAREYVSPLATPTFDSSAMDGFAVVSDVTRTASPDNPVTLRVQGCILAGDADLRTTSLSDHDGLQPCVEIMTGAKFPVVREGEKQFDAVVRKEDVVDFNVESDQASSRCIRVSRPLAANSHKRFAGSDFDDGDLILRNHEIIRPHHIMAMASLGFINVHVRRRVRIGVWSTGNELAPSEQGYGCHSRIMDANGPFLEAALGNLGAEVDFLGTLDDDETAFKEAFCQQAYSRKYDILITSGAVSKGKLDFVPSGLKSLGAVVRFHGVAMRPGHPVLFATLPIASTTGPSIQESAHHKPRFNVEPVSIDEIVIFGLPGNPVATAACTKFLVVPYMNMLLGMCQEVPIRATVVDSEMITLQRGQQRKIGNDRHGTRFDHFKHGILSADPSAAGWRVRLSTDQSPAKLRPFSTANCWCHTRSDEASTTVNCFPF